MKSDVIDSNEYTMVHYSVDYEFSSPLLNFTSRYFMDSVGDSLWNIFMN